MAKRTLSRAMTRKLKRGLAMTMAASMIMSVIPMSALAEVADSTIPTENTAEPNVTTSGEGTAEAPTITVTVTETTNGNTTTTETNTVISGTTTDDGTGTDAGTDTDAGADTTPDTGAGTATSLLPGTPADTLPANTTTTTTTTTVAGEENKVDNETADGQNRPTNQNGTTAGEETTTTTTTTTETTYEQNPTNGQTTTDPTSSTTTVTSGNTDLGNGTNTDVTNQIPTGNVTVDLTADGKNHTETFKTDISGIVQNLENNANTIKANAPAGTDVAIEKLTDDNGNVVGYTVTQITTTNVDTPDPTVTTEATGTPTVTNTPIAPTSDVKINLPDRPAASDTTINGTRTVVTVTDILDPDTDEVIGYETTTTVTQSNGNTTSNTDKIWGTKTTTTVNTTETTTTTTYLVTSTEIKTTSQSVNVSSQGITTATDRVVTASMSNAAEGSGHGNITTQTIGPADKSIDPTNAKKNDGTNPTGNELRSDPNEFDWNDNGGYSWQDFGYATNNIPEDQVKLTGYGLYSTYLVQTENSPHDVRQYELTDSKGNITYAYCVELGKRVENGANYSVINLEDVTYFANEAAEDSIRTILQNGYLGVADDNDPNSYAMGSLEAVKELLRNSGYSDWNTLNEGQAMAATQAAIWKFGNKGDDNVTESDLVKYQHTTTNVNGELKANGHAGMPEVNAHSEANITALYNALINAAKTPTTDKEANLLNASDITGGSITVGQMTQDNEGETDEYLTNISFTLAIVPSDDDTLMVQVYEDGVAVTEPIQLVNGTKAGVNQVLRQSDGTYTLTGIKLNENVKVSLNISGTQKLNEGVYVYTCEGSQTFVGITEGTQYVNLNVDLGFNVADPTVTLNEKSTSYTQDIVETTVSKRNDTNAVTKTVEVTTVEVENRKEWSDSYNKNFTYNDNTNDDPVNPIVPKTRKTPDPTPTTTEIVDESTPLANMVLGSLPAEEILEEEVPLGNMVLGALPKTGDASILWIVLSFLSSLGLAGLGLVERKFKQ